ncbi:MAG TPA: hypothetical protein VIT38_14385 [Allosphingosinicella sp.]|jgi:hypothetical protein
MSKGPSVGLVLVGLFIILFGLCIALVGGGCTILILLDPPRGELADGFVIFLLMALAALGIGILILWGGYKVVQAGYARDDGPSGPDAGDTPQ